MIWGKEGEKGEGENESGLQVGLEERGVILEGEGVYLGGIRRARLFDKILNCFFIMVNGKQMA